MPGVVGRAAIGPASIEATGCGYPKRAVPLSRSAICVSLLRRSEFY